MAITSANLKFYQSARMVDEDDGGGRMTVTEIVPGVENGIFDDVSDVDRAAGDVSLRKVYAAVSSTDTDKLLDAGIVVFEGPTDPNSSVLVFSTGSFYDERAAIQDHVESYLTVGVRWPALLYGDHIIGQKSIALYGLPTDPAPNNNKTLCLVKNEGENDEYRQYVRVIRTEEELRVFEDDKGPFTRKIVTCELTDPLREFFVGEEVFRSQPITIETRIRDTVVAAAARYYGIQPLTQAAALGATSVYTPSLFAALVPALQAETAVLDVNAATDVTVEVNGGARTTSLEQVAHTQWIEVSEENQQLVYTALLLPKPYPGSVRASYRAQGSWYTLVDDGEGTMEGQGVGTVNYLTGSVSLTLSALPDINSAILWAWGSGAHSQSPVVDLTDTSVFSGWAGTFSERPLPGSVTVTWMSGGIEKVAADQETGAFTGDGTGKILYAQQEFYFMPNDLPDPNSTPVMTYQTGAAVTETFTPTKDSNGFVALDTSQSVRPNSCTVTWNCTRAKSEAELTA